MVLSWSDCRPFSDPGYVRQRGLLFSGSRGRRNGVLFPVQSRHHGTRRHRVLLPVGQQSGISNSVRFDLSERSVCRLVISPFACRDCSFCIFVPSRFGFRTRKFPSARSTCVLRPLPYLKSPGFRRLQRELLPSSSSKIQVTASISTSSVSTLRSRSSTFVIPFPLQGGCLPGFCRN